MKKKLAFVDLTNYKDWPLGGMLEYELAILPIMAERFEIDLWGFSVDGVKPDPLIINGKEYPIHIFGNSNTGKRIIPNFYKGANIINFKSGLNKYDVVYCHSGSCAVGAHFAMSSHSKLVYHQHGLNYLDDYHLSSLIQRPFYFFGQKFADLVLVVSDAPSVAKYAFQRKKYTDAKYVAIGSPIDLNKFDEVLNNKKILERGNKDAKKFIYTGRLSKYKNVRALVAAFELYVKNGHPDAILNIAGDGEELDLLNSLKEELGIMNNVNILGKVAHDDIYKLLSDSDVFLTASGGEGCSVSVLEAYASGLPVICGKVRGLEGQVINNETGLFVDAISAKGFYDAMVKLNNNIKNISLGALGIAKTYDRKIIANKICDEIESLFI